MKKEMTLVSKVAAAEFFCNDIESALKEVGVTKEEFHEALNAVPYDFYEDCISAFRKSIISAQASLVRERYKKENS